MPLVPARVTAALVAVLPEQLDRTARAGYPSYFWSQVRNSLVIALPSQGAAAARPDAVEDEAATKATADSGAVHSFATVPDDLATITPGRGTSA